MKTANPIYVVLVIILFFAMGLGLGWYIWGGFTPIPTVDPVFEEARRDSVEQAKWTARGDSLRNAERMIQFVRDSAELNAPLPTTQRDELQRAMASEPLSVHADSLSADPIR